MNFPCILTSIRVILGFHGTFRRELVPYDFVWVALHTILLISFHLRCVLGGSVWIRMKSSNLFRFIEGPHHFSTSWHAKMSLTLDDPIENFLCSDSTSKHAPKTYRTWKVLYAKQPTPDKKCLWSEGNPILLLLVPLKCWMWFLVLCLYFCSFLFLFLLYYLWILPIWYLLSWLHSSWKTRWGECVEEYPQFGSTCSWGCVSFFSHTMVSILTDHVYSLILSLYNKRIVLLSPTED